MNTQSIIVYRNPAEAAFWQSGMFVPLFGGLGVGMLVFILLTHMFDRAINRSNNNTPMIVCAILSVIAGAFTFHWLLI